MRIGVPKEQKPGETRVALTPAAVRVLCGAGHAVMVGLGAGHASGHEDREYQAAGATLIPTPEALYADADLIVKVKEPLAPEVSLFRDGQMLFSYLHLAAQPVLASSLASRGVVALAFETLTAHGALPLLAPMSDIAGRLAVQIGATLLHRPHGGGGVLLGGASGADRGRVVVLGAGEAGGHASRLATAVGARVTVFERRRDRQEALLALGGALVTRFPDPECVAQEVAKADLVIGAVLIPGARAPRVVTREMVSAMRPGSVVMDIAIDQGGCIETVHPTDYQTPTYEWSGVVHFGVTNMPAAVPRTATEVLSGALLPYVLALAERGDPHATGLEGALNIAAGRVVHPAVAAALGS